MAPLTSMRITSTAPGMGKFGSMVGNLLRLMGKNPTSSMNRVWKVSTWYISGFAHNSAWMLTSGVAMFCLSFHIIFMLMVPCWFNSGKGEKLPGMEVPPSPAAYGSTVTLGALIIPTNIGPARYGAWEDCFPLKNASNKWRFSRSILVEVLVKKEGKGSAVNRCVASVYPAARGFSNTGKDPI